MEKRRRNEKKKLVNSIPTHKITTVNILVYFFPLFCSAYFFHIIVVRWYTSAFIYCLLSWELWGTNLVKHGPEHWFVSQASSSLLSYLLFPWSSMQPSTNPKDNEAIMEKSYQTRLKVPIILNCPFIIMKLTAISPRLTQNKSIPQQQFNLICVKEVMNTNGNSKGLGCHLIMYVIPLPSHRRFAMMLLFPQQMSLMLLGEQHTEWSVLQKMEVASPWSLIV